MALERDHITFYSKSQGLELRTIGLLFQSLHLGKSSHLIVRVAPKQQTVDLMVFLGILNHQRPHLPIEVIFSQFALQIEVFHI